MDIKKKNIRIKRKQKRETGIPVEAFFKELNKKKWNNYQMLKRINQRKISVD